MSDEQQTSNVKLKKISDYHNPTAARAVTVRIVQSDGSTLEVVLDRDNLPPGFSISEGLGND